jgi:hypothetical protein
MFIIINTIPLTLCGSWQGHSTYGQESHEIEHVLGLHFEDLMNIERLGSDEYAVKVNAEERMGLGVLILRVTIEEIFIFTDSLS